MVYDTSAVITLAAHPPFGEVVRAVLGHKPWILTAVVVDELAGLASAKGRGRGVAEWAATAIDELEWLGEPQTIDDDDLETLELVEDWREFFVQESGRPEAHRNEHRGESVTLAMASDPALREAQLYFICEDHSARVQAAVERLTSMSTVLLMHNLIRLGVLKPEDAEAMATELKAIGCYRGDYTAEELKTGKGLGQMGKP